MLNKLSFGVDVVKHDICVKFSARSENHNFEVLIAHFEAFLSKRADVKTYCDFHPLRSRDNQLHIRGSLWILCAYAVRKGLVKVENYSFFDARFGKRQIYHARLDVLKGDRLGILDHADTLENVNGELPEYWTFQLNMFKSTFILDLPVLMSPAGSVIIVSEYMGGYWRGICSNEFV